MESQLGNVEIYPPSPLPTLRNPGNNRKAKRGMLFDVPWIIILVQFIVILALVLGLIAFFLTRSESSSTTSEYSTRTYQNFELQTISPSSSPLTFRRRFKTSTESPEGVDFNFSKDLDPVVVPVVPAEIITTTSTTKSHQSTILESVNSVEVFENDENLRAAVFTSSAECSAIGKSILVRGGNAVEAAIAASFCLMGAMPNKASLGGGLMMTVKTKNGNATTIIARETAPMNADIDELKKNPELTHVGPKASGTPGTLNGLYRAFQKFSSNRVQWKHLVLPTIQQCNKGFKLSEDLKKRSSAPALAQFFKANVQKDKILCTSLSTLLTDIADYESPLDAFYHGETAQKLAKELGGYMTASDLEDYESDMSSAICSEIDVDTKVCGPGSPSSFAVLANTYLATKNMSNLAKVNDVLRSSMGLISKIADPMFVKSSKKYTEELAKTSKRSSSEAKNLAVNFKEDGSTEVFVIDENNMTVSVLLSLGDDFGSLIYSSSGFFWNNKLRYFDVKNENVPLSLQPGKVPTSLLSPIVVVKNNSVFAVSGGSDLLGLVHLLRDITHRNYDASKVAPSLFVQNSGITLKSPSNNKYSITGY
ncbi:Gamma-glutamyltranspeptidase 1 [Caenorhabditis elegans]|uniref:Gamma-glutamyltranspeptidase 1 n=1 Tax=Caenorhabditis elegans TaxID=6239 RepID=A0A486WVP7_CAEEL|nr:Gamma-glutamyltranspeptidase 1 [Caenorhabditis elegans]VGM69594.1 Gamma-glutamyltranspeptidase 1 [Caenorhabditis elegans]